MEDEPTTTGTTPAGVITPVVPTTTTPVTATTTSTSGTTPDVTPSQAAAAAAKPVEPVTEGAAESAAKVETPVEPVEPIAKSEPEFDLDDWDGEAASLPAAMQPIAKKYEDLLAVAEEEIKAYEGFIKDMEVENLPAFKAVSDELAQTKKELEEARRGGDAATSSTTKLKAELEQARAEARHTKEAYEERIRAIEEKEVAKMIAEHKAILTAPQNRARVEAILDDPEHWDVTHLVDLVTLEPDAFKEAQQLVKEMSPERVIEFLKLKSRAKVPGNVAKQMVSTGVRPAPPAKADPGDYETRLERAAKSAFDKHTR